MRTKGDGDGSRVSRILAGSSSLCQMVGTTYFGKVLVVVAQLLPLALYCAARAFVVVEAFISLRSLPADAYRTPNGTAWLPHL
jgi:hypothetical protein